MMRYSCKYAPVELFAGFGVESQPLDTIVAEGELVDEASPSNLCGFSRALAAAVAAGQVKELIITNCCDCLRRVYDLAQAQGTCNFLYLLDVPHCADECGIQRFARSLQQLQKAYEIYSGASFSTGAFMQACTAANKASASLMQQKPYIALLGVKATKEVIAMAQVASPLPVENRTCLGSRDVHFDELAMQESASLQERFEGYARGLLAQTSCARMGDTQSRRAITEDPQLAGVIYHTLRFCDWYGPELARISRAHHLPVVQLESDYTRQNMGQLQTRLEAFGEQLTRAINAQAGKEDRAVEHPKEYLVAGIDSGSASTDVVIMDGSGAIVAYAILPTAGSATASAEASLQAALDQAGIKRDAVSKVVTTGYGRTTLEQGDSVTEISCHALGAHYLNPAVRTVIDIGGQDSKAISVDEQGNVVGFAMNDKCAAGTGRFLEMVAKTLHISLDDMRDLDMQSRNAVVISSTCSVFADSEVVSLVAKDTPLPDIVAGLCNSVASRTTSLARRVGVHDVVMMTGGVAKNSGVVRAMERALGCTVVVDQQAQICGALGAALFALR